jgi:hypothetical protein
MLKELQHSTLSHHQSCGFKTFANQYLSICPKAEAQSFVSQMGEGAAYEQDRWASYGVGIQQTTNAT